LEPLPHQQEFREAAEPDVALVGGYGAGKTITLAACAMEDAIRYPGNRILVGRFTAVALRETTWETFRRLVIGGLATGQKPLPRSWFPSDSKLGWREGKAHWELKNGSSVIFRHLDEPLELGSFFLGSVYLDEAEQIPEEVALELSGPRLRHVGVPHKFRVVTNFCGHNWVWRWFVHDKSPRRRCIEVTSFHNPTLPADTVERLKALPEDVLRRRVYGSWDVFEGQVFSEFDEAIHVCDPFPIPTDWRRFRGLDIGLEAPTACVWLAVSPTGKIYVTQEHYQSGWTVAQHAERILLASAGQTIQNTFVDPSACNRDAVSGRSVADEYNRLGLYLSPGVRDPRTRAARIRELLHSDGDREPQLMIFRTCHDTIENIRQYRRRTVKDGADDRERFLKRDDHAVDALGYAICGVWEQKPEQKEEEPAPGTHAWMVKQWDSRRRGGGSGDETLGELF
jgi:phage terminase large subunit